MYTQRETHSIPATSVSNLNKEQARGNILLREELDDWSCTLLLPLRLYKGGNKSLMGK